jgi:hypothetical protein
MIVSEHNASCSFLRASLHGTCSVPLANRPTSKPGYSPARSGVALSLSKGETGRSYLNGYDPWSLFYRSYQLLVEVVNHVARLVRHSFLRQRFLKFVEGFAQSAAQHQAAGNANRADGIQAIFVLDDARFDGVGDAGQVFGRGYSISFRKAVATSATRREAEARSPESFGNTIQS